MDHNFTKLEILNAIANWDKEPFTAEELQFLLSYLFPKNESDIPSYINANLSYPYGENDIQSFILEILSEQ